MATFTSKAFKALMTMTLALPLAVPFFQQGNVATAESAVDPAPVIEARGAVNGKKILFDNTHGQTAGAADWVIDGAFSDFGNGLADNGYYVKELRKTTPITLADLEAYDVFVIPEANIPYKASEQDAMLQYVQNGGSIFFVADHYNADRNKNRWDSSEAFNGYRRGAWTDPTKGMSTEEAGSGAMQGVTSSDWLAVNFGVRFRYNAIGDVTANNIVAPSQAFGITTGVNGVAMHAGSTLAITDPTKAKGIVYIPQNPPAWGYAVDQGVYNGGGTAEGPYVAVSKVGLGKAGFIGDSSPVEDATPKYLREENGSTKRTYDGYLEQDDAVLLENLIDWLATDESYTNLTQVSGLQLDTATALYDWEQPANTTETQAEPWAAPAAGYKWWDPSTFAAGSYGHTGTSGGGDTGGGTTPPPSGGDTGSNSGNDSNNYTDPYAFEHQSILPSNEVFQMRVVWNGLTPGQTYNNWRTGIYLPGGLQVAKFQNADGTWPSSNGYSEYFSVTADANGHAEKIMTVQINGSTGSAYLRMKQGTTNIFTESVTLGNVAAEPINHSNNYTDAYAFEHQATLPSVQEFEIRVVWNGLTPGQTYSNWRTGIYLPGGLQVAKFQNADGTWPTANGYSEYFTIKADSKGHAEKVLKVRINGSTGDAYLRMKQGTTNIITESVVLGDVAPQPLP